MTTNPPVQKEFDSNYRKVMVAARRARQIQSGAKALVPSTTNKACRLAQDEIRAGLVGYVHTGPPPEKPTVEDTGITHLVV